MESNQKFQSGSLKRASIGFVPIKVLFRHRLGKPAPGAARGTFKGMASLQGNHQLNAVMPQSMIRKSGNRFSEKIMLKQRDEITIRFNLIGS